MLYSSERVIQRNKKESKRMLVGQTEGVRGHVGVDMREVGETSVVGSLCVGEFTAVMCQGNTVGVRQVGEAR